MKKKSRTIFIGDIHGCFDELIQLLEKLKYQPKSDRLISVGDLVHKGPKSSEVLDFFIFNDLEAIIGNHDYRFLNALSGKENNYPLAEEIVKHSKFSKKELRKWLQKLPFFLEEKKFLAVHGAFNPQLENIFKTSQREMITGRYFNKSNGKVVSKPTTEDAASLTPWYKAFYKKRPEFTKTIIFGHWAKNEPVIYKNFRGLDTGCCYGGHLTAYMLEKDTLYHHRSNQPRQFNY